MGKGIWVLIIVVMGMLSVSVSAEGGGNGIAYLQNGVVYTVDFDGKNKVKLTDFGNVKVKTFYTSSDRTKLALVTEDNDVYLGEKSQFKKIFGGRGEISSVIFLNESDLVISAVNGKVIEDTEIEYSLSTHFIYSSRKLRETSLPHDKVISSAGEGKLAAFDPNGMLKGSFKVFDIKTGKSQRISTPDAQNCYFPSLSPDGHYLAYYFKDEAKEAKGGMGIKVYDLISKKVIARFSPIYCYPSSSDPEPMVWDGANLTIHVCLDNGKIVKNTIMRIDLTDVGYLHESEYSTKGQYDFLVTDAMGEDALFLYRECEKRKYNLYLVPVRGCSEDKIETATNVEVARFIKR